ncbi:myosin-binding protein 3 [Euphorbia lathyris]|uniref:myosin-binding protein 3 n=1 Tax=Euphorbia lathyris TaxID=212925 RepID=UPI0033142C9B
MVANKFATMLHKNTHKLTVILVYALLEWILIILLLLNSFFLYLITKFANYFGLKPPCLWCSCSTLHHLLDPANHTTTSHTDLICEPHATHISTLGFCSNHRKLAQTHNMCTECLASRPNHHRDSISVPTRIAFISLENACTDTLNSCSCCNQTFTDHLYSPYNLLLNHSWKALNYTQKGGLIIQGDIGKPDSFGENEIDGEEQHQMLSDVGSFGLKEECSGSESNLVSYGKEDADADHHHRNCVIEDDFYELNCVPSSLAQDSVQSCVGEDFSLEFIDLHFDKDFECQTNRLIPVELLDSSIFGDHEPLVANKQDADETSNSPLQIEKEVNVSAKEEDTSYAGAEKAKLIMGDIDEESSVLKNIQIADTEETDDLHVNETQEHESTPPLSSLQEDHSSANSPETYMFEDNKIGTDKEENIIIEESISADKNQETRHQLLLIHSESNEAEEEKFPETPTSVDSLHKKRESGIEESIDGSVSSEIEGGDPVQTVEKLSTALKSERKALNALYSELEEERSASAIAANQTMAMINRLQEEKAAMQMEALQYQRMMEEQSEYDQEALQLLNELMMKREREKHELERELEVYRKKVMDYEAKERTRMIRRNGSVRSRSSSATCSNEEDIDELSIDLNREARDEENTSNDEVINLEEIALDCVNQIGALDDSLAEFEEERLSILDQLKALEEKLITLHNNELEGFDESYEGSTPEESDVSLLKDKHLTGRSMAKSLLPLLDAAENETEQGLTLEENAASEMEHIEKKKKVGLEEEVDHVYERLQALEADREFLKHCMSSIKKGDKGIDLLQEILQHLRDLRAVEVQVRVRNMSDDLLE